MMTLDVIVLQSHTKNQKKIITNFFDLFQIPTREKMWECDPTVLQTDYDLHSDSWRNENPLSGSSQLHVFLGVIY